MYAQADGFTDRSRKNGADSDRVRMDVNGILEYFDKNDRLCQGIRGSEYMKRICPIDRLPLDSRSAGIRLGSSAAA